MLTSRTRASSPSRWRQRALSTKYGNQVGDDYVYYTCDMIGEGMSSKVYKGIHIPTRQTVSVKAINKATVKDNRLGVIVKNEVQLLGRLNHPNLLKLETVKESAEQIYIVTEFCNEGDLQAVIKKEGRLSETRALQIMKDVIQGFRQLVKHKILHRDLKPANIFLCNGHAKIADFGFAMYSNDSEAVKLNVGSPLYMPIETLQKGLYSHESDIFALGIILYEMLHGKTPWRARTEKELISKIKREAMTVDESLKLSSKTTNLLRRCLAVSVSNRIKPDDLFEYFQEEPAKNLKYSSESKQTEGTERNLEHSRDRPSSTQRGRLLSCYTPSTQPLSTKTVGKVMKCPPLKAKNNLKIGDIDIDVEKPLRRRVGTTRVENSKENSSELGNLSYTYKPQNFSLRRQVASAINRLRTHICRQRVKFLPSILILKLNFTLEYYYKTLYHEMAPVIPTDLLSDIWIADLLRCTQIIPLSEMIEPFIRRIIRLMKHYIERIENTEMLGLFLTFYRHIQEVSRDSNYWSRTVLWQERVCTLEEFENSFTKLQI